MDFDKQPTRLVRHRSSSHALEVGANGDRSAQTAKTQTAARSRVALLHFRKRTYVELALLVLLVILVAGYRTELISLIGYPGNPHRLFTSESDCSHHTRYLRVLQQPIETRKEKPYVPLVVFVPSVAKWKDRRARVRSQWAKNMKLGGLVADKDVAFYFVVGKLTNDWQAHGDDVMHELEDENARHQDMVLFDGPDSDLDGDILNSDPKTRFDRCFVSSTTSKVYHGLRHAAANYRFDYVFRLDNDAYLRVDVFFKDMMPGLPKERVIMGNYLASNKAGPLWWNYFGPTMPAYATGMGYVLSADLVRCVSEARGVHWRLHHPEDGTVPTWWAGHVLNRMQTNRFHDRWGKGDRQRHCGEDSVLIHYMRAEDYDRLDEKGALKC